MPSISEVAHKVLPKGLVHNLEEISRNREYERTRALDPSEYSEELAKWFYKATGEQLDRDNPKTFNQKIQWLKLFDSTEEKGRLADKYLVRPWIEKELGPDYLVPLIGEWPDPQSIDFDALPQSFVLKETVGSGTNIFVKDKTRLDIPEAVKKLERWNNTDFAFAYGGFELHYSYDKPRIIAEEYMDFESEPHELVDYRFFNSWGKVFSVWCDTGSATHQYHRSMFTPDWEEIDATSGHPRAVPPLPKPKHYEEMLSIVQRLGSGFAFSRVDLYEYRDHVRFGEITFAPQMGAVPFNPAPLNEWMGDQIALPADKKPFKGVML